MKTSFLRFLSLLFAIAVFCLPLESSRGQLPTPPKTPVWFTADDLVSLGLSKASATTLIGAVKSKDKNKADEATKTMVLVVDCAANLRTIGAKYQQITGPVEEIAKRRLTDRSPGGAADDIIGKAMIEVLLPDLDPELKIPSKIPGRPGRVAVAIFDAIGNLAMVGLEYGSPEVRKIIQTIVD
jgi:hypothetical protein